MNKEKTRFNRISALSEWGLFIIHPVTAVITAFANYRSSFAKNIVWLFVAFYGFTMVISDEGMDANRYRDDFLSLSKTEVTAKSFVGMLYQEDSQYVDIAQPLISLLVSRITNDPRILFAVFGLIFGYFYSRNIWFLLDRSGKGVKGSSIIYLLVFAIVVGFWSISGFRMWTAAHIFFFGAVKYFFEDNKTGILISATSVLFHFSFMLPVSLLLIYILIPKKIPILYWFFIASSLISEIDIGLINNTLTGILPGVFHHHIQGYTNLEYVEGVASELQTRNWRFLLYAKSIKWVTILFMSVIYFNGRRFLLENRNLKLLFCFALFLMASINLVSNIPSVGRFYLVAYLFAYALIYIYLQLAPDFKLKDFSLLVSFPLLLFYCVGMIQVSFLTIGLLTLLGNPINAILPFGAEGNINIGYYIE